MTMTNSVKLKLKPVIFIWHVLQGNLTSHVFTIIEVAVERQEPMDEYSYFQYRCVVLSSIRTFDVDIEVRPKIELRSKL